MECRPELASPMTLSPGRMSLAVEDALALDDADAKAGQVVFSLLIYIGKDRRLAAQEGAFGLDAAVADPLDDRRGEFRVVAVHGDVIEKQQGLCACAQAVVDGHGDEVDADGRVAAGRRRRA